MVAARLSSCPVASGGMDVSARPSLQDVMAASVRSDSKPSTLQFNEVDVV